MDAAQILITLCAVSVAVGAPQLNIPGVRTTSTNRDQAGPSFSSFPSRFNQNRNIEAEISDISVENPTVSSIFRTNSLTRSSQGSQQNVGNGNDALTILNNRISSSTGSSGSGITSRTKTNSIAADEEPVMLMPYSFNYNVADDDYQTYHSRQEESDGETVVGSYSYVDPTGALITVNYRAGLMGYTETREKQANFLTIRSNPVKSPKKTITTSSSSAGSGSKFTSSSSGSTNNFSSSSGSGSGSSGGSQQLTTTVTKKKSIDQAALIAQIIAALQPQISSIVDSSIDEVEEVTEEKTVTVQKIPNISSTFQFSEQSSSGNSNRGK